MRKLADLLMALALVALADVVLFHFGAYFPLLQPESYSGRVEWRNRRLGAMIDAAPDARRVVVMGNSMAEACVREGQLEAELTERGQRAQVISYTIGGSSPRGWYVLLRNSRIGEGNTEVVVLVMHNGSLRRVNKAQDQDIEAAKTRAKIVDAFALASARHELEGRLKVLTGVVFRTLMFRDDGRQYLENPARRHQQVAEGRARQEQWLRNGVRFDNRSRQDLLSVRLGSDGRLVFDELDHFLKSDAELRQRVEKALRRRKKALRAKARGKPRSSTFQPDPSKLKLFGRLVDDLNRQGIKVVIAVAPATPYALKPPRIDHLRDLTRDLRQRGADVDMWHDPELLRRLHAPAFYQDEVHVNAEGGKIYTSGLAGFLASALDGSKLKVYERLDLVRGEEDDRPHHERQGRGA